MSEETTARGDDATAPGFGATAPGVGATAPGGGATAPGGGADRSRASVGSLLRPLLVPRLSLTHLVGALLCAALGFGVVAQVRQTDEDVLSGMRQDDLVRLLDDLDQRNEQLTDEQDQLRADLVELRTSTSTRQAAQEAAEEQARVQAVLAGTVPVHGPGVVLTIRDPQGEVRAQNLVTILEEFRNAGAEAIELSGRRLTGSSFILDHPEGGIIVDGVRVEPPYTWSAIGEPDTISVALGIPGGALATIRAAGGTHDLQEDRDVRITAVRELDEPEHAEPVPPDEGS